MSDIKLPVRKKEGFGTDDWVVFDNESVCIAKCNEQSHADAIVAALNHKCKPIISQSWGAVENQDAE